MRTQNLAILALALGIGVGCSTSEGPAAPTGPLADETLPSIEDDLAPIQGKDDTGYLSNLAAEIEGTFTSTVEVDVASMNAADRQAYLDELLADEWEMRQLVDAQIKFAKNEITTDELHLNLSSSDAQVVDARIDGDNIVIEYAAEIESIVTIVDLEESGRTIDDVLGGDYRAMLPSNPELMSEKVGDKCLEDGHEDAQAYNYFYYYEPTKAGCAEAMAEAGTAQTLGKLELHNLAPSKKVFPEYDKLTEDGKIDVLVFFGAADHGWEPGDWDWGVYQRDIFVRQLSQRGFVKSTTDEGDLYKKTVAGLEETIRVIGPETLKLLKEDTDGLFRRHVSTNEIIFYNGHSFYGSLSVLDDAEIYSDKYQIFFMNSCWSYEYYTKQIFRHNVTANDPEGWLGADVVNDTESGWFHNMAPESRILLTNLLRGAETGGEEGGRVFDWEGIIEAMNKHGIEDQKRRGSKSHEIYGVSGVRTNQYDPNGTVEPDPEPTPGARTYTSNTKVEIPDNNPDGAASVIEVADAGTVKAVTLNLEISHTWRGDLKVELRHDGKSTMVFDGDVADTPSGDNVVLRGEVVEGFEGAALEGEWTLHVIDQFSVDTGSIDTWSLEIATD